MMPYEYITREEEAQRKIISWEDLRKENERLKAELAAALERAEKAEADYQARLKQYGALVRKRDAEICLIEKIVRPSSNFHDGLNAGCDFCAQAIEREELP